MYETSSRLWENGIHPPKAERLTPKALAFYPFLRYHASTARTIALDTGGQPGTKTPRPLCLTVQLPMHSVRSGTDS